MQHDYPYNDIQAHTIIKSLKKGECPLKYAYFGDGAYRYRDLLTNSSYDVGNAETQLIRNRITGIYQSIGKPEALNIVDIGCGDGSKVAEILRGFPQGLKTRYLPVDISPQMLEIAEATIKGLSNLGKINIHTVKSDFESELSSDIEGYKSKTFNKSLFLFLGNTLGNTNQPSSVIHNIVEAMDKGDYLLVGVGLWNQDRLDKIKESYSTREVKDFVFTTLEYHEMKQEDGYFRIELGEIAQQINITFNFRRNRKYIYPKDYDGRPISISFNTGDSVTLATSNRFSQKRLKNIMHYQKLTECMPPIKNIQNTLSLSLYKKIS